MRRDIIRQPKTSSTSPKEKKMNISFTEPDGLNITSMNRDDSVICLSSWIDSWSVYISDIAVVAVNFLFSIFATLINLAVIVTVKRTGVLHRPFNALICSLAAADCLSGLVAQPVYASWRLLLHTTKDPCGLEPFFQVTESLIFLFVGCTFLNLAITSVERLFAVSKPIAYSTTITLRGMVKTVIIAWVIWFIYIFIMVTAVPEVVYKPMKNITATSLMFFLIGGHVLSFFAIHINTRKIVSATHNSQHTRLFQREKKAFMDMTLYTIGTFLSMFPILLLENANLNVISRNILLPWAATFSFLVSSFNPVIQIWRNATLRQALKTALRG